MGNAECCSNNRDKQTDKDLIKEINFNSPLKKQSTHSKHNRRMSSLDTGDKAMTLSFRLAQM
jgi:hypothetical protein